MLIEPSDHVLYRACGWERSCPDRIYMTQPVPGGVRDYTWAEALDEARRVASYLRSFAFPPGTRIAILSKNCAHFVMSDLAIWLAGYVSVALYPTLQPSTVRYILEHSDSKLIFVGKLDDWETMRSGVPATMPRISYPSSPENDFPSWDVLVKRFARLENVSTSALDDTALMVYTSGSTGEPKGIEHTFRSLSAAGKGASLGLGIGCEDRLLSYLPLAHVFERGCVEAVSLAVGTRLFFAESLDTFVEAVKRARPTVFHSVPRLWLKFQQGVLREVPQHKLDRLLRIPLVRRLVKKKILRGLGLDQARLAISGSAPIPPELLAWYRALGLDLLEGYGMSENFAYSHVSMPGQARLGYVGSPLPGVEHRIGPGGEVLIKSPADMKGYYRSDQPRESWFTEDGFLRTGDRGELDEQGRLKLTGRVKELFKTSKGKYVAPAPVENLLMADANVELACVMGSGEAAAFAVVQPPPEVRTQLAQNWHGFELSLHTLLERVNGQLEEHERLAFIAVANNEWLIENGFLTPTLRRSVIEASVAPLVPQWFASRSPVISPALPRRSLYDVIS
jgi:long-chain acyl-CoA synthetase